MFHLILVLLALTMLAILVNTITSTVKAVTETTQTALGDDMPKTFQRIAYVVLILLMLGVVTGWLGAA